MNRQEHILAHYDIRPKHADFNLRAVEHADQLSWVPTDSAGVSARFLEAVPGREPRLALLIRFAPGSSYDLRQHHGGEEFLVLEGVLADEHGDYPAGIYVRNPIGTQHIVRSALGCLLFVKLGEFATTDHERRVININDSEAWLAGPVDGTRVLPLHVHDTRNVLMIRWDETVAFKPGLDPQGDELYVVSGRLKDSHGEYGAGTWIRNPIEVWQSWWGEAGTLVYYKNGHFPSGYG